MLPTRRQYDKWSLPSKWSFWAAVIGIPVGIVSLLVTFLPLLGQDPAIDDRKRLLLQVAQELRNNDEWLASLAIAVQRRSSKLPVGSIKTEALVALVQRDHDLVVRGSYGEEKYIYQRVLLLRDLGRALGSPRSTAELGKSLASSEYSLHDVHFLNNFMFWYVSPFVSETLSETQLYSLGWSGLPGDRFKIDGVPVLNMRRFVDEGKPITEYAYYLGLID